jgi:hypothetical protein
MAYTFNGSQELTYPNLVVDGKVLVAEPGQTYDLDTAPDDQWAVASAPVAPQAPETAPESSTAPATPADN